MSKESTLALKAQGEQQKLDLKPTIEAQAQTLRIAEQAAAAASEALIKAQAESAGADAEAAAQRAAIDALVQRDSALDKAIRDADNAADIFGAVDALRAGEVAEDLVAPFLRRASDLESEAQQTISPAPPAETAPVVADPAPAETVDSSSVSEKVPSPAPAEPGSSDVP